MNIIKKNNENDLKKYLKNQTIRNTFSTKTKNTFKADLNDSILKNKVKHKQLIDKLININATDIHEVEDLGKISLYFSLIK